MHHRHHHHRPRPDAAVDGARRYTGASPIRSGCRRLRRGQPSRLGRQGRLLPQRRRLPDAHQEEPGAAGPALLQPNAEVGARSCGCEGASARSRWRRCLLLSSAGARAFDDANYPDLSGQWLRINQGKGGQITFDPTKSWGVGQEAPLTPEYQAILEASIADQAQRRPGQLAIRRTLLSARHAGDHERLQFHGDRGAAGGHLCADRAQSAHPSPHLYRRARLAGEVEPTFQGYSIGHWIDSTGSGRYDVLEVETRGLQGAARHRLRPACRCMRDNQTVVKERIYLDKADPKRAARRHHA